MERKSLHLLSILVMSLSLFSCSKAGDHELVPEKGDYAYENADSSDDQADLAIGTIREKADVRYIQLDPTSAAYVINPAEIQEIPVGTRVFLEYRRVLSSHTPDFCTEAILVEWASPLDVGGVRYEMVAIPGDPVSIVKDWITSVEDGFLTIHYAYPSKGKVSHDLSLYPGKDAYEYRLVHEAHGDTEGDLKDGIICFPLGDQVFETDGTITFSLIYIGLNSTWETLTIDYRNPK